VSVKYKGGEKKTIVPPDVPIVTYRPGDKAEIKPGTTIFVFEIVRKLPDGTLQVHRVNYGDDVSSTWAGRAAALPAIPQ
jgi:hypothetical protein